MVISRKFQLLTCKDISSFVAFETLWHSVSILSYLLGRISYPPPRGSFSVIQMKVYTCATYTSITFLRPVFSEEGRKPVFG